MKTFKAFFYFFFASALVLSVSSCGKGGDDEELGPHIKEPNVERFNNNISVPGTQILDFRSEAEFNVEHIPGAINIPATLTNTASDNGEFAKKVLSTFPDQTKKIYMYGGNGGSYGQLEYIVPGRISRLGYGQANSIVLLGGFKVWKDAGFEVVQ